jgi:cytochrome c oxidase assembly protein subunit 15
MHSAAEKRFIRVNLLGIISLFLVILAGGVVRSSGSGMGCPDWPKCFDQYVPPTSVSQLPANYQEKYVAGRVAKNERFAKTLDVLGYGDLALRIREDKSILLPEEFNVTKTWTEYINRLIGAICGLFLLGAVFFSFPYLKTRKRIFFLSVFNVFLIGFQAWLGSIVVSTNLLAWVVTVHMLVALAIIAISMYTHYDAKNFQKVSLPVHRTVKVMAFFLFLITIGQIILGTEVREQIDGIASFMNNTGRELWVDKADFFKIHRSLTILVISLTFALERRLVKQYAEKSQAIRAINYSFAFLGAQAVLGISLAYFALPPVAQALHLVFASLLFGAQFYVVLALGKSTRKEEEASHA